MLMVNYRDGAVAGRRSWWLASRLRCREPAFPVLLKEFPVAKDFPHWSDKILRNRKSLR
jgi:hypothetical protein